MIRNWKWQRSRISILECFSDGRQATFVTKVCYIDQKSFWYFPILQQQYQIKWIYLCQKDTSWCPCCFNPSTTNYEQFSSPKMINTAYIGVGWGDGQGGGGGERRGGEVGGWIGSSNLSKLHEPAKPPSNLHALPSPGTVGANYAKIRELHVSTICYSPAGRSV